MPVEMCGVESARGMPSLRRLLLHYGGGGTLRTLAARFLAHIPRYVGYINISLIDMVFTGIHNEKQLPFNTTIRSSQLSISHLALSFLGLYSTNLLSRMR